FDRLFYKVDLRHLRNRALLFLPTKQIEEIRRNIQSMGLLLEPPVVSQLDPYVGWKSLTLLSLLHEARVRAGHTSPNRPLSAADEQFLTQLLSISRSATDMLADQVRYASPWQSLLAQPPAQKHLLAEPQYFFSGDGTLAFLLVRPIKEAGSFTPHKKSVDAIREIAAAARPQFPEIQIGLTGLPVLENDEMAA